MPGMWALSLGRLNLFHLLHAVPVLVPACVTYCVFDTMDVLYTMTTSLLVAGGATIDFPLSRGYIKHCMHSRGAFILLLSNMV